MRDMLRFYTDSECLMFWTVQYFHIMIVQGDVNSSLCVMYIRHLNMKITGSYVWCHRFKTFNCERWSCIMHCVFLLLEVCTLSVDEVLESVALWWDDSFNIAHMIF